MRHFGLQLILELDQPILRLVLDLRELCLDFIQTRLGDLDLVFGHPGAVRISNELLRFFLQRCGQTFDCHLRLLNRRKQSAFPRCDELVPRLDRVAVHVGNGGRLSGLKGRRD